MQINVTIMQSADNPVTCLLITQLMHVEPMMFNFYCFMSHVYFFHSKCIKQLLDLFFFGFEMRNKQC